jgi:hypothetical protein
MFVEAKREIPWTKPEDIRFIHDEPLPEFGGFYRDGFHAVWCDSSVRLIPHSVNHDVLKALITKAGNEIVPEIGN